MPNPTSSLVVNPKDALTMRDAFEAAWGRLRESGRVEAQPYKAEATRKALALRIIDQAHAGLLSVGELRDDALAHVLNGSGDLQSASAATLARN